MQLADHEPENGRHLRPVLKRPIQFDPADRLWENISFIPIEPSESYFNICPILFHLTPKFVLSQDQ